MRGVSCRKGQFLYLNLNLNPIRPQSLVPPCHSSATVRMHHPAWAFLVGSSGTSMDNARSGIKSKIKNGN